MKAQILFVDDDQQILDGIHALLRKYRHKWDFHFANSALEALQKLKEVKIDLIVSDIQMPNHNGIWLLENVKKEYPHIVRILLSGYADNILTIQATAITQQYLSKPLEATKLIDVLERNTMLLSFLQNEYFKKLTGQIGYLPSVSEIYVKLIGLIDNPETSSDQLARVIERDVGLTAKIMQIANSSFFALAKKTTQVKNAIVYIGSNVLKSIIINEEIGKLLLNNRLPENFSVAKLNRHSFNTALIMKVIAPDAAFGELAFIAGILHEVGQLVLASQAPEEMYSLIQEAQERQIPLHEVEYERHGVSHAEIGAYLLSLWGISTKVVEAVANHHRTERIIGEELTVSDALDVADYLHCTQYGNCNINNQQLAIKMARFAKIGITSKIEKWREEVRKLQFDGDME